MNFMMPNKFFFMFNIYLDLKNQFLTVIINFINITNMMALYGVDRGLRFVNINLTSLLNLTNSDVQNLMLI